MAHLDATDLNDIQVSEAWNEKRFSPLGMVDAVKDSTEGVDYIPPSAVDKMRTASSLRNVDFPVFKDQQVSVGIEPGFNFIPSNLPESDKIFYAAVNVFTGFRHYPAQYANNQIDAEWGKVNVMQNVLYAAGNKIEELLSTTFETRKSQVLTGTTQISQGDGTFTFDAPSDTLQINKAAQKELLLWRLQELMDINELTGQYRIVTNRGGLATPKGEALKYREGNEKNLLAWDSLGVDRMYETGNIAAGSDVFNGFLFRDGAMGVIENYPFDFANGTEINGRKWSISDVELPYARMRANIYVNNEATNAEALVGAGKDTNLTMTHFAEMAMWFRFYIVYRYNSDLATRANDIVKIKGLTT